MKLFSRIINVTSPLICHIRTKGDDISQTKWQERPELPPPLKEKKNGRETKSKSGAKGFWTPQHGASASPHPEFSKNKGDAPVSYVTVYPKRRMAPVSPQSPCTLTAVWNSGNKQAAPAHFESQSASEIATHEVKSHINFHLLLRNISFSVKTPTFRLLRIIFFFLNRGTLDHLLLFLKTALSFPQSMLCSLFPPPFNPPWAEHLFKQ